MKRFIAISLVGLFALSALAISTYIQESLSSGTVIKGDNFTELQLIGQIIPPNSTITAKILNLGGGNSAITWTGSASTGNVTGISLNATLDNTAQVIDSVKILSGDTTTNIKASNIVLYWANEAAVSANITGNLFVRW